jgi:ADP-dependent phosphofructokinase/glucokinase
MVFVVFIVQPKREKHEKGIDFGFVCAAVIAHAGTVERKEARPP